MTIKKRLFISNVLMVVIPFVVSIVTFWVCILILNMLTGGAMLELIELDRGMRHAQMAGVDAPRIFPPVFAFFSIIAILYFTNRFLTAFILRRIKQPLEMLAGGVREISEGNLSHRIIHDEDDEFKPVCEAFNDMALRLKASVDEVQRNEQNRKELLAGISHDLRSPLTSIKAFVEGLLDGVAETPDSQREYLLIIKQKTDDINSMVSQLLMYSKLDMGNFPTHPEALDIRKEITDFVFASEEEFRAGGLTVEVSGDGGGFIWADPLQLRSVLANILGNSAKYKERETAAAAVRFQADGGIVRITFEDDGPGVPEDALPMLFDVFYRTDPSRNNPNQGSGLGLAITAKALERMGGAIRAENIEEGGLRVTVEIPEMTGGEG